MTATVTISNKANTTRTFRGLVESRAGDSDDWSGVTPITARIRAGQSAQRKVTLNSSSSGSVSYRLAPFEKAKTIEYVAPTFAFGESYTTTQNVKVTVDKPQTAKSVKVDTGFGTDRITPPPGKQFVLARIQTITVGQSEATPFSDEFFLKSGSQTFPKSEDVTQGLLAPIDGSPNGGVYNPDIGEEFSWYGVWPAPKQVSPTDVTIQWISNDDSTGKSAEKARWTKGGPRSASR